MQFGLTWKWNIFEFAQQKFPFISKDYTSLFQPQGKASNKGNKLHDSGLDLTGTAAGHGSHSDADAKNAMMFEMDEDDVM